MSYEFGTICNIGSTGREGIVVSTFKVSDSVMISIYPISLSVYLAGDSDFIFTSENHDSTPLMAEAWNPLIVNSNILSKTDDKINNDFIEYFKKFVIYRLMGLKIEEKKLFTGPPITSKTDIRYNFRQTEFSIFSNIRLKTSNSLIKIPVEEIE